MLRTWNQTTDLWVLMPDDRCAERDAKDRGAVRVSSVDVVISSFDADICLDFGIESANVSHRIQSVNRYSCVLCVRSPSPTDTANFAFRQRIALARKCCTATEKNSVGFFERPLWAG
eukprot:500767_1